MRSRCHFGIVLSLTPAIRAQVPQARLQRGLAAVQRGDCPAGVPDLQAALSQNPNVVPALNAMAVCESQAGHHDQAAAPLDLPHDPIERAARQGYKWPALLLYYG